MKKISTIILIILIVVGGYWFLNKNPKMPKNPSTGFLTLNNSLNEYEKILNFYEKKGGLKTSEDMLQFSTAIQTKFPNMSSAQLTKEEYKIINEKFSDLKIRQTKLLNSTK
jgi:hypothetical protein